MIVSHYTEWRRNINTVIFNVRYSPARNDICKLTYKPNGGILVFFRFAFYAGKFKHLVCQYFVQSECYNSPNVTGNSQKSGNFPWVTRIYIQKMRFFCFRSNSKHSLESFYTLCKKCVNYLCIHA